MKTYPISVAGKDKTMELSGLDWVSSEYYEGEYWGKVKFDIKIKSSYLKEEFAFPFRGIDISALETFAKKGQRACKARDL